MLLINEVIKDRTVKLLRGRETVMEVIFFFFFRIGKGQQILYYKKIWFKRNLYCSRASSDKVHCVGV